MDHQKLDGWLKVLAGASSVLYLFGFLVVHARLIALGAWASGPVVSSLYLVEGGRFVQNVLSIAMTKLLPVFFAIGGALWLIGRVAPRVKVAFLGLVRGYVNLIQWLCMACLTAAVVHVVLPALNTVDYLFEACKCVNGNKGAGDGSFPAAVMLAIFAVAVVRWIFSQRQGFGLSCVISVALALATVTPRVRSKVFTNSKPSV